MACRGEIERLVRRGAHAVRRSAAVRAVGAFVIACVIVLAMLIVGLHFHDDQDDARGLRLAEVSWMSSAELARVLGADERAAPPPPSLPFEGPELPRRVVRGLVELAFTVEPDGSVSNIEVLDATPPGHYEQQARATIASRRYPPAYRDGVPVASERTEIVDFRLPAD